jgi:heat shock protein HtpX
MARMDGVPTILLAGPRPAGEGGEAVNQLKTILLLGVLSVLIVAAGAALGPAWAWGAAAIALGLNLFAWFFSDKLVLRMSGAREVSAAEAPALHALVNELSARAGLPPPRVHVIDQPHANAFATGRDPAHAAVAVTRGLLEVLDSRELRGVLAHELAHVKNRDVLVATVAAGLAAAVGHLASVLAFSGLMGSRDGEEHGSGAQGLLFMLIAPIGATLVQLGISRSREYLADEEGARISGDPLALASALEKLQRGAEAAPAEADPATASLHIVNPFGGLGGLARLFSTHPPTEDRIRRLREMAVRTSHPPLVRGAAARWPQAS